MTDERVDGKVDEVKFLDLEFSTSSCSFVLLNEDCTVVADPDNPGALVYECNRYIGSDYV